MTAISKLRATSEILTLTLVLLRRTDGGFSTAVNYRTAHRYCNSASQESAAGVWLTG